jgi:F420-dependent oxidoreductase-like protein
VTLRIGLFPGLSSAGSIDDVVADVRLAHEQGFATYWVPQIFGWDALTLLAVVGRETEGIELGTSVVPTYPRHPSMLAAQAITAQAACGGRLTLGIGLSHRPVVEQMLGMSFDRPVRHLREHLDVLLPLLDGDPVATDGQSVSAKLALDIPEPRPAPVPVMVAALGSQVLCLAGARTAGTITWMTGAATLAEHTVPHLTAAALGAGRIAPRVVCGLPICVTDDVEGARARAAELYAVYGLLPSYRAMLDREGASGPEDLALIGDEASVARRLRALEAAGATDFSASEFGETAQERVRTRTLLSALAEVNT